MLLCEGCGAEFVHAGLSIRGSRAAQRYTACLSSAGNCHSLASAEACCTTTAHSPASAKAITSSHHHIITSSDYHIITSSHHYVITSSHHHIITSSHHYVMCTCSSQLCYARNACCACYVCYMRHDSCVPAVVQARPVMRRAVASAVASRRSALGRGIAIGAAAVAGGTTSGAAAAAGPRRRRGRGAGAGTTAHLQAQGEAGGWCHTTGVLRVGLGCTVGYRVAGMRRGRNRKEQA